MTKDKKQCSRCKKTKTLLEFHRNGKGFRSICKECTKQYREENRGRFRDRWRLNRRAYRKENPKSCDSLAVEWRKRNPEKHKAHLILRNKVLSGKIKKPKSCQICGKDDAILNGHHEDYTKPLKVYWLCSGCHGDEHRKIRNHLLNTKGESNE